MSKIIEDPFHGWVTRKTIENELKNIFKKQSYSIYSFVDSFVLETNRKVVGYGGIWSLRYDPETFAMMDWLSIKKEYRNHGLGSSLMKFLLKNARKRGLKHIIVETDNANRRAIKFYKRHGFKRLCTIPGYYNGKLDLVMMLKKLN